MAPRNPQILVGVEGLKPQDLFHTFPQGYGIMVSMLRIKNVKQKESERIPFCFGDVMDSGIISMKLVKLIN